MLGMHRSGTSAITGSLEQAGLYLGNVTKGSPDNKKGSRESELIMALHEDILQRDGGSWNNPATPNHWQKIHRAMRDCIIEKNLNKDIWGFKDPRTLLVLNGWLKALPHAELVGIFRHPFFVAESLNRRNGIAHEDGLNLWVTYNRILLWYHNHHDSFPLVEFSNEKNLFQSQLEQLIVKMKLQKNRLTFFDGSLRQSLLPDIHCESSANLAVNLYGKLQSLRTFV